MALVVICDELLLQVVEAARVRGERPGGERGHVGAQLAPLFLQQVIKLGVVGLGEQVGGADTSILSDRPFLIKNRNKCYFMAFFSFTNTHIRYVFTTNFQLQHWS